MRQYVYAWTAMAVRVDTNDAGEQTIRPHATVGVCLAVDDCDAHESAHAHALKSFPPPFEELHVSVLRVSDEMMMGSLGSAHECAPRYHRGRT